MICLEQPGKTEKTEYAFTCVLERAKTEAEGKQMKNGFGYKLLLLGCLLIAGPILLTEVLGFQLYAFETLISASQCFGLLLCATAITVLYYRGKRRFEVV